MTSSLNIALKTVSIFIIALICVSVVVVADDCRALCGYTPPTTIEAFNATCYATGDMFSNIGVVINWNDGTSSIYNADIVVQLAIGSCCSDFLASNYGTGVVTSGRFIFENITFVYTSLIPVEENGADDEQTCNACQSSGGLTRDISDTLLLIGTKGVGNWIECTGTSTNVFSPALTSTPQTVFSTFSVDYDQCSNCVESC